MLTITVARRPLEGTMAQNVTKYGVGGLNIDACRITSKDAPREATTELSTSSGYEYVGWYKSGNTPPEGRWPSNLILQHHPKCLKVGSVEDAVPSFHKTEGSRFMYSDAPTAKRDGSIRASLVDIWHCVSGCPIAALNAQSGILQGRGNQGSSLRTQTDGVVGWTLGPVDCGSAYNYDEGGGASRFFLQVQK